eukprot:CAMPEP_0117434822 /NCGR_PEP_ID=MMETSP0759-20121206/150_1 /TAXON_ID=63605 /ORGANISM="Percolomonas cosmopolitus, Strain WS" /LENGTH=895 /DNA_ID=CAMNT_0005226323 /DNA_START=373 /DNA_END=3060 /DNA_ORIENTATION=-
MTSTENVLPIDVDCQEDHPDFSTTAPTPHSPVISDAIPKLNFGGGNPDLASIAEESSDSATELPKHNEPDLSQEMEKSGDEVGKEQHLEGYASDGVDWEPVSDENDDAADDKVSRTSNNSEGPATETKESSTASSSSSQPQPRRASINQHSQQYPDNQTIAQNSASYMNPQQSLPTQSSQHHTQYSSHHTLPSAYLLPEDDQIMYLSKISTKIQKIYRRDASAASRADKAKELELDELLEEMQTHVVTIRDAHNEKNLALRIELDKVREHHEEKIQEWSQRYEKVQKRWKNLMNEMRNLQYQKEEIRQERDLLLCEHKQNFRKKALLRGEPTDDEKKAVKEFFIQTIHEILTAVKSTLGAERGSVFVYDHPTDELVSLALVPDMLSGEEIRVPSNKGIVGDVFTKGRALNILNAYKDNRFYKNIDQKTGYVTRVMLAYPLISKNTGTTIGCIQLINKEKGVFTIEDEARMSQFVYVISRMFDCVQSFYDFGSGGGSVGYGGDDNMTDSQTSSLINVKRIGEKESATNSEIGFLQKHGALIPKYIEDFIHKLHKCWRIAVDESGKFQNKIAKLKQDKMEQDNYIRELRKELEKKRVLIESLNKTIVAFSRETLINQAMNFSGKEGSGEAQFQIGRMKQMHKRLQDLDENLMDNGLSPISEASNVMSGFNASNGGGISPSRRKRSSDSGTGGSVSLPMLHSDSHRYSRTSPQSSSAQHYRTLFGQNNQQPGKGRMDFSGTDGAHLSNLRMRSSHFLTEGALFGDVFESNPLPMLLLSTSYHVCACNRQFCRQLNYRPRDLIGIMFQNVLFKIDVDMLPRMLQFEYVESISVKRRPQKSDVQGTSKLGMGSCVKMDVYISQIGKEGMAFKLAKPSRVVNAPLYVLTFMKSGSSSVIAT